MILNSAPGNQRLIRVPGFVRLWIAATASGIATWAMPFVLGLAVIEGVLSAVELGIALGVRTVGFLAGVLIAGVYGDRYSRTIVLRFSGSAAALATILIAISLGQFVAGFVIGALISGFGQGSCRPAISALTADIVAPKQRQAANAAMAIAVRLTALIAPAAAALAVTKCGVFPTLMAIAALWVVATVMPRAAAAPAPDGQSRPFFAELGAGFREAYRHRWFVAGLAALAAVIFTGYSVTSVVLPIVSTQRSGEMLLAGALTAYTIGALVGAVIISRWRPRDRGWAALGGLALYATVPTVLLIPSGDYLVFVGFAVAGFGIEIFNVQWFTATQREVPAHLLSRVSSVDFLVSYGLAPLGLAFLAPALHWFGTGFTLTACAVICLTAPAIAMLAPHARTFGVKDRT